MLPLQTTLYINSHCSHCTEVTEKARALTLNMTVRQIDGNKRYHELMLLGSGSDWVPALHLYQPGEVDHWQHGAEDVLGLLGDIRELMSQDIAGE